MSRELGDHDWQIFKKLCPELKEGMKFRSILPPISKFYSTSKEDFSQRIEKLSDEDLDYLIGLVESGDECLNCIAPEFKDAFVELVHRRTSKDRADKLKKFMDFLSTLS